MFAFDRVRALAPEHPEWKTTQPFKGAIEQDMKAVVATGEHGLMQIMAAKGQLDRDESERSHVYVPAIPREHAQQQMATDLMERAFAGSLRSLVMGALGGRRATKKELAELRALIEEHEDGKQPETGQKGRTR